jgi:hypothetical protein
MNDVSDTTTGGDQPARPRLPRRTHLGRTASEDEGGHLRRVAEELGGANSDAVIHLRRQLDARDESARMAAAARLGTMGDRYAIAELRALLESNEPRRWELAVHGLRQNRDRAGWLCLESVALDHLDTLASSENGRPPLHALRLLVMGRTKTMDRLFRAADGHSRSIPKSAAVNFTRAAVRSVPRDMSRVMAMRLGVPGGVPATPEAVSAATGLSIEDVRALEARAWETVQRPRAYAEIMKHYGENK